MLKFMRKHVTLPSVSMVVLVIGFVMAVHEFYEWPTSAWIIMGTCLIVIGTIKCKEHRLWIERRHHR